MNNNESNMSDDAFYYKYIELIKKGYADDSPEMIELFKSRAAYTSNKSKQQSTEQSVHRSSTRQNSQDYTQGQPRVRSMPNNSGQYYQPRPGQSASYPARKKSYSSSQTNKANNSSTYSNPRNSSHSNSYSKSSTEYADSKKYISHIIIDPISGNYTLLDSHLNVVDSMHSNPLFSFFTQKHKLRKFKKQLKTDFKSYTDFCKRNYHKPNYEFKKMFSLTKYYLKLCPDADYQILELLRNNITRINPYYSNYQTACAEYLYELAQFRDGDPSTLPFDINFCCDKINNNHIYIANRFDPSSNPVQSFRKIYSRSHTVESEFQSSIRCNVKVPNSEFSHIRNVRAPIIHDRY